MSLSVPTKNEIKSIFNIKWSRICLDPDVWNIKRKIKTNPISKWKEIKFTKKNIPHFKNLNKVQGIYMFVAKPNTQYTKEHSYILYIGQTSNLKDRYKSYFDYEDSTEPSDHKKRCMVIVWKGYLYFHYIRTRFKSTNQREKYEYDFIDSIAPIINDKFRSKIIKSKIKTLGGRW